MHKDDSGYYEIVWEDYLQVWASYDVARPDVMIKANSDRSVVIRVTEQMGYVWLGL